MALLCAIGLFVLAANGDSIGDDADLFTLALTLQSSNDVDIGEDAFNQMFRDSPEHILKRECSSCGSTHRVIYYKRYTDLASFNLYRYTFDWESTNNVLGDDFNLFSTLEDALADTNPWTYCNYDDDQIGMFRDCGPTGYVAHEWTSRTRGGDAASFYIYTGIGFEASFTTDSLSADSSIWLNEGTLGSSIDMTSLTGSVRSEQTNTGRNIDALCFDGLVSDITFIDFDTNSAVRPDLTMEVWWRPDQYENNRNWILGHDDGGYDRAILSNDDRFGGLAMGLGTSYSSTLGTPTLGEWIHIVATYSADGTATLYKNGGDLAGGSQQSKTVTSNSGSRYTSVGLNGLQHYSNHQVVGCFAQVQLTDRVVSPEEVQEMFDDFDVVINIVDHIVVRNEQTTQDFYLSFILDHIDASFCDDSVSKVFILENNEWRENDQYHNLGTSSDPVHRYAFDFDGTKFGDMLPISIRIETASGREVTLWGILDDLNVDSEFTSKQLICGGTATLTTHSDNKGVHSISNDGGASWTDIGTQSRWETAFSYDLIGVSADTKIRVTVKDVGVIGGLIATVLFDGEQYSTTNPLQDGHWKLVSASDGDTSLIYKEKTSSPWGISTAEIASDAFWVWNEGTHNTLVFEFDFDSVFSSVDVVSAGSSIQNVLFELSTSSEGGYVFELSTSTVRTLVAALCVVVTVVLAAILCRGRSEKRRYRAVDVFGSDTEPITEVEAAKLKGDEV